LIKEETRIS